MVVCAVWLAILEAGVPDGGNLILSLKYDHGPDYSSKVKIDISITMDSVPVFEDGIDYWENQPASLDGVLGGFGLGVLVSFFSCTRISVSSGWLVASSS